MSLKMVNVALFLSLYTYHHETPNKDFPWVKDVPDVGGLRLMVKVTMH